MHQEDIYFLVLFTVAIMILLPLAPLLAFTLAGIVFVFALLQSRVDSH